MRYVNLAIVLMLQAAALSIAQAQTQVDLRTQSKAVNFSGAPSTLPMTTGTTLPSSCTTGQMFFVTNAAAGANLYACTSANTWTIETGGGASAASSLPDFSVSQSSSTTLTIGGSCASAQPCKARFGNTEYSVLQPATATITAGTGAAYIYLLPDGSVNVGSNVTIACSQCNAVSGVTAFPASSIPLAVWLASGGIWTSVGSLDVRAFQSTAVVVPQTGLTSSSVPGQTLLGIDTTIIGLKVPVPALSSSTCTAGSWSTDGSYYYLCVSTNTWMRAALSSF